MIKEDKWMYGFLLITNDKVDYLESITPSEYIDMVDTNYCKLENKILLISSKFVLENPLDAYKLLRLSNNKFGIYIDDQNYIIEKDVSYMIHRELPYLLQVTKKEIDIDLDLQKYEIRDDGYNLDTIDEDTKLSDILNSNEYHQHILYNEINNERLTLLTKLDSAEEYVSLAKKLQYCKLFAIEKVYFYGERAKVKNKKFERINFERINTLNNYIKVDPNSMCHSSYFKVIDFLQKNNVSAEIINKFYEELTITSKISSDLKFDIYGSCVSRDIFRVTENDEMINHYYTRSTWASQFLSESLSADTSKCIDSKFKVRCIEQDLNKTIVPQVGTLTNSVILDISDERFDLLHHDKKLVVKSEEFKLLRKYIPLDFSEYKPLSKEVQFELFKIGFERFINLLDNNINIYLIKFAPAKFDEDNNPTESIAEHGFYDKYYEYIESNYPNILCIYPNEKYEVSSTTHFHGASSLHYIDDYYCDLFNKILESELY